MRGLSLQNIAAAVHGTYHGPQALLQTEIEGACLDSRLVEPQWLFIATKGERVDGHSFISQVYEKGALCAICERELTLEDGFEESQNAYIVVQDSFLALKALAAFYLQQLSVKVVGITGSVGKTSTKEMIAGVLSEKYNVLKTAGNFNNEVGLPLTVLRLRDAHEVAVLEMGISDFEEMHRLGQIARPDIVVITNIGQCHLENLGDRDGVLRAKTEVFDEMKPDGDVILNGDDDKLCTIQAVHGRKPYFFHKVECAAWDTDMAAGDAEHVAYADVIVSNGLLGTDCKIHIPGGIIDAHIKVPGTHQVNNALAAALVGLKLGLSPLEIERGIEKVTPIGGRTNLIRTEKYLLVDDCYNANPVSMKAAADLLATANTRTVAVLGDMFELGGDSDKLHFETGAYCAAKPIDVFVLIGEHAKHLYDGVMSRKSSDQKVYYFVDKQSFLAEKDFVLQNGDTVLLKASHGMGFTKLVEALQE